MDFPGMEAVRITRASTSVDDHGDSTATPTVLTTRALIAPRSATESVDPRAPRVIVGYSLYFADELVLDSDDEVAFRGETFRVEGQSGVWRLPGSGEVAGTEVAVTRGASV